VKNDVDWNELAAIRQLIARRYEFGNFIPQTFELPPLAQEVYDALADMWTKWEAEKAGKAAMREIYRRRIQQLSRRLHTSEPETVPPDDTDSQGRYLRALLIEADSLGWSRHPATPLIRLALNTMLPPGVSACDASALKAVKDADLAAGAPSAPEKGSQP
jgi:hypothetical protein